MFRGRFGLDTQIQDFHPPIGDNGLYWVVPVPTGGLQWSSDGRSAKLAMRDIAVINQPKWPMLNGPTAPARMSFTMTFEATDKAVTYDDPAKSFRLQGFLATCRMEAEVSTEGFSWKSDPIEKCPPAAFAVIGEETNGKYYRT